MPVFKLQSAMEYLLTYGWAILIIGFVMVALFSLEIFGGSSLSSSCIALSGYICQSPILHGSTLSATIGQDTGSTWTAANVIWVPQGVQVPANLATFCPPSGSNSITGGMSCFTAPQSINSGATVSMTLVFSPNVVTGQSYGGQLWMIYQTGPSSPWYQAQIATATLKAV